MVENLRRESSLGSTALCFMMISRENVTATDFAGDGPAPGWAWAGAKIALPPTIKRPNNRAAPACGSRPRRAGRDNRQKKTSDYEARGEMGLAMTEDHAGGKRNEQRHKCIEGRGPQARSAAKLLIARWRLHGAYRRTRRNRSPTLSVSSATPPRRRWRREWRSNEISS